MDSRKTTDPPAAAVRRVRPRIHPRRLAYRWRVLLPTLGLMWIAMLALALFQHKNEDELRRSMVIRQMDRVSAKVLEAYASGVNVTEFVDFIDEFFENTSFDDMRVSVYSHNGGLVHNSGAPIPFSLKDYDVVDGSDLSALPPDVRERVEISIRQLGNVFYYASRRSTDGKVYVLTAMPTNRSIDRMLARTNRIWYVIFPIILLASIAVFFYVSYITRSVTLLADFADSAAEGKRFDATDRFPDDEFGRISRQIISLYRGKEAALEQTKREQEVAMNAILEKMRFKRETTNNINHELKTPLGIIKGYVDTIVAQPDMPREDIYHFLQRAASNVDRLTTLINDVSTITRLEDGTTQIVLSEINFHDVVYTIAGDIASTGVYAPLEFTFDVPLDCLVRGNLSLLQSVLHNFMRNAHHHSHGTRMAVEYMGETPTHYTFRFYDNGRGVPEESIAHLFERFYRVDKGRSRKSGDTGLGLAIVQSTIQALGGVITVKNRSTGGLEFVFTLRKFRE